MIKKDLTELTVTGLKALATKKKIALPSGAKKADLIAVILKADGAKKSVSNTRAIRQKKTVVKRVSAKINTVKKAIAKKPVSKKKTTVNKAAVVKTAKIKAVLKKTAAKKVSTEKTIPKQTAARKTAIKKAPIKKVAIKKTTITKVAIKKVLTKKAVKTSAPIKALRRTWLIPKVVQESLQSQEKVADAKYYTGPETDHAVLRSLDKLPAGYGEERITLIVRDPSLIYAYWEATPSRLLKERSWLGMASSLVIRMYNITGVQFDGRNAIGYFDQDITEPVGSCYFETGRQGHSLCADLGLRSPEGRFLILARSNYITLPRDSASDVIDEEWMLADEKFWQLYGFPDGISSLQVQELWRRRHLREISSSGLFSRTKGKSK